MRWFSLSAIVALLLTSILLSGCAKKEEGVVPAGEEVIIVGTVVSEGKPLPEAMAEIEVFGVSATTDDQGIFKLSTSSVEGEFQLTVTKEGYIKKILTVDLTKPGTINVGTVEIVRLGAIEGTVRIEGEEKFGGVKIVLEGTDISTTTKDDGSYRLANVPPGSYTLIVGEDGKRYDVEVVPGQTTKVEEVVITERPILKWPELRNPVVNEMNYIVGWLVLGPITGTGGSTSAIGQDFIAEAGIAKDEWHLAPKGPKERVLVKGQDLEWTYTNFADLEEDGRIRLATKVAKGVGGNELDHWGVDNSTAYGVLYCLWKKDTSINIALGSDDSGAFGINGERLIYAQADRDWAADTDKASYTVKGGKWNVLIWKCCETGGEWGISIKVEPPPDQVTIYRPPGFKFEK